MHAGDGADFGDGVQNLLVEDVQVRDYLRQGIDLAGNDLARNMTVRRVTELPWQIVTNPGGSTLHVEEATGLRDVVLADSVCNHSILASSVINLTISNNVIEGIIVGNKNTQMRVLNNTIIARSNSSMGQFLAAKGAIVSGNRFLADHFPHAGGCYFWGMDEGYPASSNIEITQNVFKGQFLSEGKALQLYGVNGVHITGNEFDNTGPHGTTARNNTCECCRDPKKIPKLCKGVTVVPAPLRTDDVPSSLPLPTRIVVADGATETELWAAAKLGELLALVSAGDGEAAAVTQIAVGHGAATALGVKAATLDKLDEDSFLVSTKISRGVPAGSVAIASSAHSARGTLNGIYGFLRAVGFEFFATNVTRIPIAPIALPKIDLLYSPSYAYRDLGMASGIQPGIGGELDRKHIRTNNCSAVAKANNWTGGICQSGNIWRPGHDLGAALGCNGWNAMAPVGGNAAPHNPPGFVATAYNLLNPPYFNSDADDCDGPGTNEPHPQNTICPGVFRRHPTWFTCQPAAGEKNAACTVATVNKTYNSQPCWLAPGVKETMISSIQLILRDDPATKLISVSNMDGGVSAFPCAADMVAAKIENATGAGNFYAVRDIAAAVAKEFPHVKIEVLACEYQLLPLCFSSRRNSGR